MGGGGGCYVANCCVGNCGDTSSSNSKTAGEDHAALIANELAEMRERSATDAKKQEGDIIDDVNETMQKFTKWIREINKQKIGGRNLNININQIEELNEALRKKNFDDFYVARKREAIRALIEEIETSVREQSDSIEREIQNRIKELDNNMQQEARAFDDLRKMKIEQDSRLAAKQVEYMYYENLCDIMFDELKTSSLNVGR